MLAKSVSGGEHANQETPQQQMETHPVIRTLYDHTAVKLNFVCIMLLFIFTYTRLLVKEVTCVDFHPDSSLQILASGSKDYTIKFFDFSNPSVKKAQRSIPVCYIILSAFSCYLSCSNVLSFVFLSKEASPIKTLNFHPSGSYILVGTQHKTREFMNLFNHNVLMIWLVYCVILLCITSTHLTNLF